MVPPLGGEQVHFRSVKPTDEAAYLMITSITAGRMLTQERSYLSVFLTIHLSGIYQSV